MSINLLGKKEMKRLGSVANDGAGGGYTSFAKKMMEKMGWQEGQGLGKDNQGMSTYIHVKKKDDSTGLGEDRVQQNTVNDQWFFSAFDTALANMNKKTKNKIKNKTKNKEGKRNSKKEQQQQQQQQQASSSSMYDRMFKATGGLRTGMRARAAQNGKLARTEGGGDVTGSKSESAGPESPAPVVVCLPETKSKKRKRKDILHPTEVADEDVGAGQEGRQGVVSGERETRAREGEDAPIDAKARKREKSLAKKARVEAEAGAGTKVANGRDEIDKRTKKDKKRRKAQSAKGR